MLIIVLSVIIVASLAYLGYIIFRRFSDLKNLDPNSILEHRQDEAKTKILQSRLARQGLKMKQGWEKLTAPHKGILAGKFKRFRDRVSAMEERYHNEISDKRSRPVNDDDVLAKASSLVDEGKFDEAEKVLIDIIAEDKKDADAYEVLGDLYFKNKNYDQAEEIFKYLIKLSAVQSGGNFDKLGVSALKRGVKIDEEIDFLSSLDVGEQVASYYDDLTQIYEALEKYDEALDSCLKASSIEPNNPKYLDKLVELGVRLGDRSLAKKIFNRLEKIDPKNAKLSEMEAAIEKL